MGQSKNPNVELSLENQDEAAVKRMGIIDPDSNGRYERAYVFAQVRSAQEDCLSYMIIARNEPDGAALRKLLEMAKDTETEPLRNVRDAFENAPAESAEPSPAAASSGGASSDVGTFSSCCSYSKNVAVLMAGRNAEGQLDTVTLLDRYVHATFDESDENSLNWPILQVDIKTTPHEGGKYCYCKHDD